MLIFNLFLIKGRSKRLMKSVIVGTGYMGMFIAALLSRCNEVGDVDIVPEKLVKKGN